ncbi:30S ribosomal protein S4 [Candidatus Peregrinibacteria bacterium]|nr:30S ribosomal protein S4 [Candidatus Peregrinibacteria bacterium]
MKYTGPRNRLARREGQDLFLKTTIKGDLKKAPGPHQKKFSKMSEFGQQLREKQKAKRIFGITERVCEKYYREAVRRKGITGTNFLRLLEMRLDNVVYRAGFTITRAQARQMVNHRVFEVNGKRASIPSMQVSPGDIVTVREKFTDHPVILQMQEQKSFPPKWLISDIKKKTIKVERSPEDDEMEQTITIHLIIEFYSR